MRSECVTPSSTLPASPPRRSRRTQLPGAGRTGDRVALALSGGRDRPRGRAFPSEIVFAEVKARRRHAADAVSARQWARIGAAAARFLAEETDGTLPCRFDLVLVDRSGAVERIENAASYDEW